MAFTFDQEERGYRRVVITKTSKEQAQTSTNHKDRNGKYTNNSDHADDKHATNTTTKITHSDAAYIIRHCKPSRSADHAEYAC